MPEGGEQKRSLQDRMTAAIQGLELMGAEDAPYDRDILLGSHTAISALADEGFQSGEFDQTRAVEVKLEATRRAKEIAEGRGDQIAVGTMGQLETTYDSLLGMIQPAVEPPKKGRRTRKAAKTTPANAGGAKSPAA